MLEGGRIRRGGVVRLVSVAIALAALASILVLYGAPDHGVAARARQVAAPRAARADRVRAGHSGARPVQLPRAEVTIASRPRGRRVPTSFLGLSTEYWALPIFERHISLFERVLALLHVRGGGRLVLRVGGDSADHTFWYPTARRMPRWVFELTPAWLRRTSIVVRRESVRLILDLNLVTGSPSLAARLAGAAESGLPRGSIVGFEIGNEPDIYSRSYWLAGISPRGLEPTFPLRATVLPSDLSVSRYTQDFRSYSRTLAQVAPQVPLLGPAVANPSAHVNWIARLIAGPHPGLGVVSAHRYPYSACAAPSSPSYPTIARLLSERASAGMAHTVRAAVRLAHRAGLAFRLTELNSVTCGGLPGVSNAFATALWAPDALFELLRVGVDGVNVHVRADAINAAFAVDGDRLQARPLLYGLILFARTLGPEAHLVRLRLHVARSLNLKIWGVLVRGDVLHVLLIDKSKHAVSVDLRLPATGAATVERLLAPSASSRSGVTLDGQQVGSDGRWQGQPANQTVTPGVHGYTLTIPPVSAALLSVRLGPVGSALA